MYVTFKIELNIQCMSLKALFILICMLAQVYVLFLKRFNYFEYSFNKYPEL